MDTTLKAIKMMIGVLMIVALGGVVAAAAPIAQRFADQTERDRRLVQVEAELQRFRDQLPPLGLNGGH